jgi:hypothetical protein
MEVNYPTWHACLRHARPSTFRTWLDVYSGQFNRWAETLARIVRLFGLLP